MKVFEGYTRHWVDYFHNLTLCEPGMRHTKLILRTTPASHEYFLLEVLNDVVRTLVRSRLHYPNGASSVYVYDMHEDLWWVSDFDQVVNPHMFLDETHPCRLFLLRYVEKLLGLRYSAHIGRSDAHLTTLSERDTERERERPFFPRHDLCTTVVNGGSGSSEGSSGAGVSALERLLFQCPGAMVSVLQVMPVPLSHSHSTGHTHRHHRAVSGRLRRALLSSEGESERTANVAEQLVFTAVSPADHRRYFWRIPGANPRQWLQSQLLTEGDILPVSATLFAHIVSPSPSVNITAGSVSAYRGSLDESPAWPMLQTDALYRVRYEVEREREKVERRTHCLLRGEQCMTLFAMPLSSCDARTSSVPLLSLSVAEAALVHWKFGVSMYSRSFFAERDAMSLTVSDLGGTMIYSAVRQGVRYSLGSNVTVVEGLLHRLCNSNRTIEGHRSDFYSLSLSCGEKRKTLFERTHWLPFPGNTLHCLFDGTKTLGELFAD